jgi:hypothetical protein
MSNELYKVALSSHLEDIAKFVKRPDSKHNIGATLGEIFTWQTISDIADKKLKGAWTAACADGIIPADDDMRDKYDQDEHIVTESNKFSCIVTVGKPRENFDREKFIGEVARKYKLDPVRLSKLAEDCVKEGKAPLTKRIREV